MTIKANTPVELLTIAICSVGLVGIFRTDDVGLQRHQAAVARDFQFLADGKITVYPIAIFFHGRYLLEMPLSSIEFVIHHELGHIVHNHNFECRDLRIVARQECEADTYAMIESRIGVFATIKTLVNNHHRMVTMNTWNKEQMTLLNYELGVRLFNVFKSIPALVKAEFAKAKRAQGVLHA